jgi:hypothetical protein
MNQPCPSVANSRHNPKASLSPRSKSPYSTASDEVAAVTSKSQHGDQPLDLSNKGSSPSVSPLSTKEDDLEPMQAPPGLNLGLHGHGPPHPNDFLEHFRRAAAAASAAMASASGVDGASVGVAGVASNLQGLSQSTARPLDIYRFQEDLETSGSAGSGGATTDEEGRFTCEKCDKTFTKQSSLSRHKYEHSGRLIFKVGGS